MNFIKNILRLTFAALNLLAAAAYLLSAYSPYVSPMEHKYLACMGLAFPIVALANAAFVLVWVVLKPVFALFPIAVLLLGWGSLNVYCPFGQKVELAGRTLTLLTYNTQGLAIVPGQKDFASNHVLGYIIDIGADIVCLQEVNTSNKYFRKRIDNYMSDYYPYRSFRTFSSGNGVACFSRYPILSSERVEYDSQTNGSVLYRIALEGDTLVLVNNHLESNKLNADDKDDYRRILAKYTPTDSVKAAGKNLLRKLADAGRLRAPQADSVAKALRREPARLMIACGDFNDSPISYSHRVIGEGMDDAFVRAGSGFGTTYHDSRMYVRIDHILVSRAFTVADCQVDRTIAESDHYPVRAVLCY